jgi:hypothetical protein
MSQGVKDCLSGTVGGIFQVLGGQVSISRDDELSWFLNIYFFYIFFFFFSLLTR